MSLIDMVRGLGAAGFCERDGFPLVEIAGEQYCSVEYADGLIGDQKVVGIAEGKAGLELLFANGYVLPLTEPGSGEPQLPRQGMLSQLRELLIGRSIEGFRHGEWVSDDIPPERHPIFALQFSGDEPRDDRSVSVSLESIKGIHKR